MLSRYSWNQRGWCRTERMARELSSSEGVVILVQHATELLGENRQRRPLEGFLELRIEVLE